MSSATSTEIEALEALQIAVLRARVVVLAADRDLPLRPGMRSADRRAVAAALEEAEQAIKRASRALWGEAERARRARRVPEPEPWGDTVG